MDPVRNLFWSSRRDLAESEILHDTPAGSPQTYSLLSSPGKPVSAEGFARMVVFTTNSVLWRLAAFMLYPAMYSFQGASCSLRDRGNSDTTGKPGCWQDDRHDASGSDYLVRFGCRIFLADRSARPNTLFASGLVPRRFPPRPRLRMSIAAKPKWVQVAQPPCLRKSSSNVVRVLVPHDGEMAKAPSAGRMALCLSLDSISIGCPGHWPPKII